MSAMKVCWCLLLLGHVWSQMIEEPQESRLCSIADYKITCAAILVLGQNISVQGHLYPCARPMYVQFQVTSKKSGVNESKDYTFINADETQRMSGWEQYLAFHVILKYSHTTAFLKAGFLEQSVSVYFLETSIHLPQAMDCPSGGSRSSIFPILLVAVVSVLVSVVCSMLLLWWYRIRKRNKMQVSELLSNMEVAPHSSPYQEEPITSEYDGLRSRATTVIQNSVYRDSVHLDAGLDTIPEEDGTDFSRSQKRRRHKMRNGKQERKTANGSHKNGYRSDSDSNGQISVNLVDIESSENKVDNAEGVTDTPAGILITTVDLNEEKSPHHPAI